MKILFVFGAKIILLFDICKYFSKKMHFFCIFLHFLSKFAVFEQKRLKKITKDYFSSTSSPFKVAAVAEIILTCTNSPMRRPWRGKTTVLYCDVRPYISS